jgi:outer membrane protein assembly factor BamB
VATWKGKLFLGTFGWRLVALDAATGKPIWVKLTVDPAFRYTITGAPRVVKGKVIIGNGGAEMGVRGYVSAYDADTGDMVWRFYTVPGDPSRPFEVPFLRKHQDVDGGVVEVRWRRTVWDSIVYDRNWTCFI